MEMGDCPDFECVNLRGAYGVVIDKLAKRQDDIDRLKAEVDHAIQYINEITDNQIGAGEEPVKFVCASHAGLLVLNARYREALEEIKRRAINGLGKIASKALDGDGE